MDHLVEEIKQAFAWRPYPGDQNIVRCTYEKRFGGTLDGPCGECSELLTYFRGKSWRHLKADELFKYGQNDSLFSVEAYCYFLPGYLIAAVREPEKLDACVEHLHFRFGPKEDDAKGTQRISEIITELTREEHAACLKYFAFDMARWEDDFGGWQQRAIAILSNAHPTKAAPKARRTMRSGK